MSADEYNNEYDRGDDRGVGSHDIVDVHDVIALRFAGKTLVIKALDRHEVFIPLSQIASTSPVRKPGDHGMLKIPKWLADDRCLHWTDEVL